MFANRFTAVLDACVLAGALKRNIVLSLAEAELYRPRWSGRILIETERAIEKIIISHRLDDATERAKSHRNSMETAFPDAEISDYEMLEDSLLGLPDKDDAHVVAVAIKTKASIIVTDNLKDFPTSVLDKLEIEAKSTDDFIADTFDLNLPIALAAVKSMRLRLQQPGFTTAKLLIRMEEVGLPQAADTLRDHQEFW